jgi:dipeptidyl aminopeptidase/acylaminoacyl peptidase
VSKIAPAPYGSWISPISAADAAAAGGGPGWVGQRDGTVWWTELRPEESGRLALVRWRDGVVEQVLDAPWNVRNRVHEYGGRPWTPVGATVAFTNWDDQRVYLVDAARGPVPLTPEPERKHGIRYGDLGTSADESEVWCVRETVTGDLPTDVRRDLVAIPVSGAAAADPAAVRVLGATHHFLSGPRPSPDGRQVAWLGWNHPQMPWDGTELCVAPLEADGTLGAHRVLAGGLDEAVCQFEWDGPDAVLALTDPDGWWNLFRFGLDGTSANLAPCTEELGGPLWQLGARWFAALGDGTFAVIRAGHLAILDPATGTVSDVDTELSYWGSGLAVDGEIIYNVAAGPVRDVGVVRLDLESGKLDELSAAPRGLPDPAYLPVPVERVFTDPAGNPVPAYVYPPTNPDFEGPATELPPYLVHVHGGPTGRTAPILDIDIAYFTSRGIGVVAVNYGGSTGYGRAFRERLREQWGLVDVQDCAFVAEQLAAEGIADPDRLAVRGGSAGGWTAAASLTSVSTYRCGTVMFPILDLTGWTDAGGETHDFESRYVEGLVGPLPESAARYAERSPSNHADRLAGPVLMLQGLEDEICPPAQADRFMAGLEGTGIPHAYLTFEGEQHGFRRAETIIAALEAELSFYAQTLNFTPPGIPTLPLRN